MLRIVSRSGSSPINTALPVTAPSAARAGADAVGRAVGPGRVLVAVGGPAGIPGVAAVVIAMDAGEEHAGQGLRGLERAVLRRLRRPDLSAGRRRIDQPLLACRGSDGAVPRVARQPWQQEQRGDHPSGRDPDRVVSLVSHRIAPLNRFLTVIQSTQVIGKPTSRSDDATVAVGFNPRNACPHTLRSSRSDD